MTSHRASTRRKLVFVIRALGLFALGGMLTASASEASAALVGYWRFSTTDPAGTALDSAGTAQNGTFNGGAAASIAVDGTRGDVLDLNPSSPTTEGGFVQTTTMPSMADTSWVVWLNARTATNADTAYPMFMTSSGNYEFRFFSNSQRIEMVHGGTIAQDPSVLSLNTWHQVAHVQNGNGANNFTLYVDGNAVATGSGTAWGGNKIVDFGHRQGDGYYFNGRLDEAEIWSEALTLGKINALRIPVLGYDALQLEQLFQVYDAASTTPIYINGRAWKYTTGLTGHNNGDNWEVDGVFYQQLDALGNGVQGAFPVPEPSTFALLCVGIVGLAAKGRRHRRVIA